jgi:HSP20 family protein
MSPFSADVHGIGRSIDRMLDSFLHGGVFDENIATSLWTPAVDITETGKEYVVKVELPGVNKEDVKISTRDNILTIRGEKKQEKETKDASFHRVERSYGSFQRSFPLPEGIRGDGIEASYKDGILEIVLPKAEETKARSIDVKVK